MFSEYTKAGEVIYDANQTTYYLTSDVTATSAGFTLPVRFASGIAVPSSTALTIPGESLEQTDVGISSLSDTWLLLRDIEIGGERNRGMYILKSRGMAHSNQPRLVLEMTVAKMAHLPPVVPIPEILEK
jgi:hypothetical protein